MDISIEESTYIYARVFLNAMAQNNVPITLEDIKDSVIFTYKRYQSLLGNIDRETFISNLCRKLESDFTITVSESDGIVAPGSSIWLTKDRQKVFSDGYWRRFYTRIINKLPVREVEQLDKTTTEILGFLGDPRSDAPFQKKGLVIGDVQSGKTSNYTGLINKAADVGYRIIIVIAGVLNTLRAQTQARLESDFVGASSRPDADNSKLDTFMGLGKKLRRPTTLTTVSENFTIQEAQKIAPNMEDGDIVLLVINKNTVTFKNLKKFFSKRLTAEQKRELPILVIDDEADNASINSNKPDDKPTAINRSIRELLAVFNKNSYVGYTATPYANIFINPYCSGDPNAAEDKMEDQDLFPKDFIYCLGRPENYIGALRLFTDDVEQDGQLSNCVKTIEEEDDFLSELKENHLEKLPDSLIWAIRSFVLARAIRCVRNQQHEHCSMLVHVTLRKEGHRLLVKRIRAIVEDIVKGIHSGICLSNPEKRNHQLSSLKEVWDVEYADSGVPETWEQVCTAMRDAKFTSTFKVYMENSMEKKVNRLDYASKPGQTPIVIGGNSLARGITLEGLTTSYFLRSSKQFDTLMQMGRWFGYRTGYSDVCRIFMTARLQSHFAEIARITEELKLSIHNMRKLNMTPLDYGLRIRNSVSGLLITARNKMRHAQTRIEWTDLADSMLETYNVSSSAEDIVANREALLDFIDLLDDRYGRRKKKSDEVQRDIIWENVEAQDIISYLTASKGMRISPHITNEQIQGYVQKLGALDVVLITNQGKKRAGIKMHAHTHRGEVLNALWRMPASDMDGEITFKNNRIFSKIDELGYQTKETIQHLRERYTEYKDAKPNVNKSSGGKKRNKLAGISEIPGCYYRTVEGRRDLLIIALVWIPDKEFIDKANYIAKETPSKRKQTTVSRKEDLTRLVPVYALSLSGKEGTEFGYTKWTINPTKARLETLEEDEDEY